MDVYINKITRNEDGGWAVGELVCDVCVKNYEEALKIFRSVAPANHHNRVMSDSAGYFALYDGKSIHTAADPLNGKFLSMSEDGKTVWVDDDEED